MDHICYRVDSFNRYLQLKNDLSSLGEVLSEKEINGRPITVIKLRDAILYQDRIIKLIELPAPKLKSEYQEAYEHVEFVIDKSFDAFMTEYSYLEFETKGMKKKTNPDIKIKYNNLSIKFHHHSLEYVIRYLD